MPPVLVERGLERDRFDRHHLLRGSPRGDRRQVNESCHAAPCGAGSPFERFLVEIDAILSGWLRRIEARQHKRRIEANDGRRGASGHFAAFCGNARMRLRLAEPAKQCRIPPAHPWSAPASFQGSNEAKCRAGSGAMHSLSKIRRRMARLHDHESHLDQINKFYICAPIALRTRRRWRFFIG